MIGVTAPFTEPRAEEGDSENAMTAGIVISPTNVSPSAPVSSRTLAQGEILGHALIDLAVSEDDAASVHREAMGVVPVVEGPGHQIAHESSGYWLVLLVSSDIVRR